MTPLSAKGICLECGVVTERGERRCVPHKRGAMERANIRRGSAHSRGYGARWRRLRRMVLARDKWTCQICGLPGHHADHIKPKADGGGDAMPNLQCLCEKCHDLKTAREHGERYGKGGP